MYLLRIRPIPRSRIKRGIERGLSVGAKSARSDSIWRRQPGERTSNGDSAEDLEEQRPRCDEPRVALAAVRVDQTGQVSQAHPARRALGRLARARDHRVAK